MISFIFDLSIFLEFIQIYQKYWRGISFLLLQYWPFLEFGRFGTLCVLHQRFIKWQRSTEFTNVVIIKPSIECLRHFPRRKTLVGFLTLENCQGTVDMLKCPMSVTIIGWTHETKLTKLLANARQSTVVVDSQSQLEMWGIISGAIQIPETYPERYPGKRAVNLTGRRRRGVARFPVYRLRANRTLVRLTCNVSIATIYGSGFPKLQFIHVTWSTTQFFEKFANLEELILDRTELTSGSLPDTPKLLALISRNVTSPKHLLLGVRKSPTLKVFEFVQCHIFGGRPVKFERSVEFTSFRKRKRADFG